MILLACLQKSKLTLAVKEWVGQRFHNGQIAVDETLASCQCSLSRILAVGRGLMRKSVKKENFLMKIFFSDNVPCEAQIQCSQLKRVCIFHLILVGIPSIFILSILSIQNREMGVGGGGRRNYLSAVPPKKNRLKVFKYHQVSLL